MSKEEILQPLLPAIAAALEQSPDLFDPSQPCVLARAPGRLDIMGGIADYAGATVLERTLAEATVCIAQVRGTDFRMISAKHDLSLPARQLVFTRAELEIAVADTAARTAFFRAPERRWAAYILGAVFVLHSEKGVALPSGLGLLVVSNVPEGRGVSSSAACEVAALYAISQALDVVLSGDEVARLAQQMEHVLAGAPCGLMDQIAVVRGQPGRLMRIRCQPGSLESNVAVPDDICFWGIDSTVSHAVSGADYGTVRAATFMGYRILAELLDLPITLRANTVAIEDNLFGGYLANVPPSQWATLAKDVPECLCGAAFLQRYQGTTDSVTTVRPNIEYRVRASLAHAVLDSHRAEVFAQLLSACTAGLSRSIGPSLGELMLQSHESYTSVGLGNAATDAIIADVRAAKTRGIFGGRITGGGSGGTVAVAAHRDAEADVLAIAERHGQRMQKHSCVFRGSSPGAAAFGVQRVNTRNGVLVFA